MNGEPTARQLFQKGDRVRLTAAAHAFKLRVYAGRGREHPVETGIVKGFGHEPFVVLVLPDGATTKKPYHCRFWEKIDG